MPTSAMRFNGRLEFIVMQITRIWKGYKEYQNKPYFVGQRRIEGGRLDGCYEAVTKEYDSEEMAEKMLMEWEHEQKSL
jgi:hypothetical protein